MRDRSYRRRISTYIDPYSMINRAIYDRNNREKLWSYGEHPEIDINFIVISKDGTLGDIYKVGDLYIGLPNKKGKEIINKGLKDEECKWIREEPPEEFDDLWNEYRADMAKEKNGIRRNDVKLNFVIKRDALVKKYKKFVDSEYHKKEHGIFIKIDDEVMYFTGDYWFFLKHYYLTESNMYGYFRTTAMEAMWHWEAVRADSRSWGELRGKGRRTSWTVESCSIASKGFLEYKDAEIPIVSERSDLASKLFKGKIVKSYKYIPIYFKPLVDLPNADVSKNLQAIFETKRREVSSIDYYPTKSVSYDSLSVKPMSINDEIGKWKDESLTDFISIHQRCHTESKATGRFGSTAGEYSSGGGKEFEIEFLSANANKRNKMGRTENGLISFFIDVCLNMTQPISYFDKWGFPIVKDPLKPIINEKGNTVSVGAETDWNITFEMFKKKKDPKKLTAFLRDMPRELDHMFRAEGGKNNDFNITNLNNHYDFLRNIPEIEMKQIVFRGDLKFKGEKFKSDVMWIPSNEGNFETTWIPPKELQNKNSIRDFHGQRLLMPDNSDIGCFGVDPYDLLGKVENGSDGAIVGYTKFNMSGSPTNSFFLKYKHRPEKRDDFFDDVIKACMFYGFFALIENNKPRLLEYMYDNGVTGFSMRRQDVRWSKLKDHERRLGGIPGSEPVIEATTNLLKDYISDYIGFNLDEVCNVYHIDMIKEFIDFKPYKRTEYDLSVAAGYAKLGARYEIKQRKETPKFVGGLSMFDFGA